MTEEDEAFDEIARKQGMWGGGFMAKRAMAADKLQEPVCDKDPQGCWNVRCQLGKQCKNLAQPAQEQALLDAIVGGTGVMLGDKRIDPASIYKQPAQEPHEYDWSMLEAAKESLREHMARIKELEAALAQEQEPVACVQDLGEVKRKHLVYEKGMDWKDPLYTAPPQRPWVGLTDEDIHNTAGYSETREMYKFALALIAKLKEKNA